MSAEDRLTELVERIRDLIADRTSNRTRTKAIGEAIETVINDPMLAPSLISRVARAANVSETRLDELCLLLARVGLARDRGEVRSPAGYFGTSAKRLVTLGWQEPWDDARGAKR